MVLCVCMCLCSPHGCHVSKPKSHVWESRLCVCGFRLPHLWMRFNVCMFLCVWYMGIIPLVFSLKHFYMSPGDITQLFRRDILFFIFHLHTLPIYISSCSRSSVVWHIKALCLLYCGLGNIWTTASAIYQSTICQLHLTCVCGCIRIRWKEGESQHKQLPLVPFVCLCARSIWLKRGLNSCVRLPQSLCRLDHYYLCAAVSLLLSAKINASWRCGFYATVLLL